MSANILKMNYLKFFGHGWAPQSFRGGRTRRNAYSDRNSAPNVPAGELTSLPLKKNFLSRLPMVCGQLGGACRCGGGSTVRAGKFMLPARDSIQHNSPDLKEVPDRRPAVRAVPGMVHLAWQALDVETSGAPFFFFFFFTGFPVNVE